MLLASPRDFTARLSIPRDRRQSFWPIVPWRFISSPSSIVCNCAMVRSPSRSRRWRVASPTPQMAEIGRCARNASVSARPITENPRGLLRSEAILARNLLWESPMETLTRSCASISFDRRARIRAGGALCRRCVPERSRKASSIDSGSTSGVTARMRSRIERPTSAYLPMSGRMIVASGQSASALNIGMAERTPLMRAL